MRNPWASWLLPNMSSCILPGLLYHVITNEGGWDRKAYLTPSLCGFSPLFTTRRVWEDWAGGGGGTSGFSLKRVKH